VLGVGRREILVHRQLQHRLAQLVDLGELAHGDSTVSTPRESRRAMAAALLRMRTG
jgi:hypothetical protein